MKSRFTPISIFTACVLISGLFFAMALSAHSAKDPGSVIESRSDQQGREVLDQWMQMQIKLMAGTQANFSGPFIRIYGYSGVMAYASIAPSISMRSPYYFPLNALNQFPDLPQPEKDADYYWPASLNAAMAYANRTMFPMASPSNRAIMDSLERAMYAGFLAHEDTAVLNRSVRYGVTTAALIYWWAEADGYRQGNDPYAPPTGRGNWKPTAPAYGQAASPYWGRIRTIVPGSTDSTAPPPPPAYSEDTASIFYKMVREVYEVSTRLTEEQKSVAAYWRDVNPGVSAPGHWLNILRKAILEDKSTPEKAVYAYALSGMALNDTWISSWKARYTYNVQRPITYIQSVMGYREWLPAIPTPPHPEYPGGHAALSASVAEVLTAVFGDRHTVVDDTYEKFGMGKRTYASYRAVAEEAAISKVFGGIHYRLSVNVGLEQGTKVSGNILQKLAPKEKLAVK